jgi:transcriptional regulator with XRE-family HTH domain
MLKGKTKLRELRIKRGFKLTDMAERLNIGVSRYYMIENGERPATPDIAKMIAKILDVEQDEIFLPQTFTACEEHKEKTSA